MVSGLEIGLDANVSPRVENGLSRDMIPRRVDPRCNVSPARLLVVSAAISNKGLEAFMRSPLEGLHRELVESLYTLLVMPWRCCRPPLGVSSSNFQLPTSRRWCAVR